jgi:hypothetical protein
MEQIVTFGKAHLTAEEVYTLMSFVPISSAGTIKNQSITDYGLEQVAQVYINQMKLRRLMLKIFNLKICTEDFTTFFNHFWFHNACHYISFQTCEVDFYRVLAQGADKFWM